MKASLILLLLISGLLTFLGSGCRHELREARAAAETFLEAWRLQDYRSMYSLLDSGSRESYSEEYFADRHERIAASLGLQGVQAELGKLLEEGDLHINFSFNIIFQTTTLGAMPVENMITLTRCPEEAVWLVAWSPALIFPELTGNRRLSIERLEPRRGLLLDRYRRPLVEYRILYQVGAVPGRFSDREQFTTAVAELTGFEAWEIEAKLDQPWVQEGMFVPLLVLRPEQEPLIEPLLEIPGVMIDRVERRYYPAGELFGHLAGHLGEIGPEELAQRKAEGYRAGDLVGKAGLEAALEPLLAGSYGYRLEVLNEDGEVAALLAFREMRHGQDAVLTIEMELQKAAHEALGERRGALLAIDALTGEIYALASRPAFDPNWFTLGAPSASWRRLNDDPGQPFLNRALHGLYPPGSTFKPFVALAALEEKLLDAGQLFRIEGSAWQPSKSWGGYHIRRVHSEPTALDLNEAMKYSDNIYFARVGLDLGAEALAAYGRALGFGEAIPFELPVKASQMLEESLQNEIQLAVSSFGQGDLLITPLHMALLYTLFPGEGSMPQPRLLLPPEQEKDQAVAWKTTPFGEAAREAVTRSLVYAIEGPQAPSAAGKIEGFTVAGKTGTAESDLIEGNICWYVTFIPGAKPPLVVAVMIEGGTWAGLEALPAARDFLKQAIALSGAQNAN